ncbi:Uncharacterised protein [Mycobacterium tuberculosis]|nr:Uncharacterised protein [Mycobacterium tuberculosis]
MSRSGQTFPENSLKSCSVDAVPASTYQDEALTREGTAAVAIVYDASDWAAMARDSARAPALDTASGTRCGSFGPRR